MKYDKSKVYTSLTADELNPGDKVIVADSPRLLRQDVEEDGHISVLKGVLDDSHFRRFKTTVGVEWGLAYLVERKENCTNCGEGRWDAEHKKILCDPVHCGNGNVVFRDHEIEVCEYWKPKTKCADCAKSKNGGRGTCVLEEGYGCDDYEKKAEKHYRPFKDIEELVKVWEEKIGATSYWGKGADLVMPHIWVRYKKEDYSKSKGHLIHGFYEEVIEMQDRTMSMEDLFYLCEFLDGSSCGVEE